MLRNFELDDIVMLLKLFKQGRKTLKSCLSSFILFSDVMRTRMFQKYRIFEICYIFLQDPNADPVRIVSKSDYPYIIVIASALNLEQLRYYIHVNGKLICVC